MLRPLTKFYAKRVYPSNEYTEHDVRWNLQQETYYEYGEMCDKKTRVRYSKRCLKISCHKKINFTH